MSQFFTKIFSLTLAILTSAVAVNASPIKDPSVPPAPEIGDRNNGYIGIGSAIGLSGNTTALGTGGFAILSKLRFSDNFSLHDATVVFGGGAATSMIIVTADLPILDDSGRTIVSPFIGGGVMLRYAEGLSIAPAISGGIDLPISSDFTGTLRLNAGFPSNRNADVGVLVGVGYNVGARTK
jgi:hypothetical protein